MSLQPEWYEARERDDYPFPRTGIPVNLIADLYVRFDGDPSETLRLTGLSVRDGVASLVLALMGGPPVAGWSGRPVPGVPVDLRGISRRAQGAVVFGTGVTAATFDYRETIGSEIPVAPGVAVARGRSVDEIGVVGREGALDGVVDLSAQSPLSVTIETIQGQPGMVFRATDPADMAAFRARCGGRAESGACDWTPVQRVGPGVPSCDGTLTIVLAGNVTAQPYGPGTIVLGSLAEIGDVCAEPSVPAPDGQLSSGPFILVGTGSDAIATEDGKLLIYE